MCARLPIHTALADAPQVPSPQHVRSGRGIGMRQSTITASQPGNINDLPTSTRLNLTLTACSQTITFNPPTQVATTIGSSVAITAIGGASGNAVSFAISTTSAGICSLTNNGATGTAPNLISNATITVLTLGDWTITANQAGNTNYNAALSVSVTITLVQPSAQLYFIHPDHLGTPRAITKASDNTKVWEWNNDDAFGNNAPDENPNNVNGTTPFKYNLRFLGQYFDRETNTHYNYFRDYDPATGRYVQSDPIGQLGGLNLYL